MNRAVADFSTKIESLVRLQESTLDAEIKAAAEVGKLTERARLIRLTSEIRTQGNLVRIASFKAQALRDPKISDEGLENFAAVERRFDTLKPLIRVEEDRMTLAEVRADAEACRAAMVTRTEICWI